MQISEAIKDKRVLVTGGSRGIGKAIALMLSKNACKVMIIARDEANIEEVKALSENYPIPIIGMAADTSEKKDLKAVFETIEKEFGGLDVLINNAALAYGSVLEGDFDDWDYILKTNILGYLACTNYGVDLMRKNGKGHIIHIGSMSSDIREESSSVYVATKSAIQGFSETLRKELSKDNIHVTLIEPGAVNTDMQEKPEALKEQEVEERKLLEAEDIAKSVLYVLSQTERTSVVEIKIKPLKQNI